MKIEPASRQQKGIQSNILETTGWTVPQKTGGKTRCFLFHGKSTRDKLSSKELLRPRSNTESIMAEYDEYEEKLSTVHIYNPSPSKTFRASDNNSGCSRFESHKGLAFSLDSQTS